MKKIKALRNGLVNLNPIETESDAGVESKLDNSQQL